MATLALLCLRVWRISSPMGVPPGSRNMRTRIAERRAAVSASSSICVDLPQPSVPSNVMNRPFAIYDLRFTIDTNEHHEIRETHERNFRVTCCFHVRVFACFGSNPFQLRAFRRVFNDPAFGLQFVANRVGPFEIFRFARGLSSFQQSDNFSRNFDFRTARQCRERNQFFPMPSMLLRLRLRSSEFSARRLFVSRHPFEHLAPGGGNVQIVVQRGGEIVKLTLERRLDPASSGFAARPAEAGASNFPQFAEALINPRQRGARALQAFEREVERLAIMRREQQITDFAPGETLRQQIAQREKIAERLAHFFAFDEQKRAVQPVFDERLAGRAFALRDFVLVMRKYQVLAAEVQVKAFARAFSCSWR